MQYDSEELEILEAIENNKITKESFDNDLIKQNAAATLEYINSKKQISINLKQVDLDIVKQKANDLGISYQNIIQALVHNYATSRLELRI
jgi:predicted DNA binding CopG/RHH family protein